jgi:outer membrane lipoprotein-sorting protein
MSLFLVRPLVLVLGLLTMTVAGAAELPIIARARAYLGSEAALNSIETIHYYGSLVTNDPTDPKKQTRADIEIVLQRPDRQKVTIVSDKSVEATALDSYEAWTRVAAADDMSKWQQTLLGVEGVKRLRANTWENLAYFRGLEREGGRVEDRGSATIDGIPCEKVAFIHTPNIVFTRYFDKNTGKVIYTETEAGGTIREQGEIVVNGVRFPKSIITVSKNQAGQAQTVTITFSKVVVNETLPPDFFSVPPLRQNVGGAK